MLRGTSDATSAAAPAFFIVVWYLMKFPQPWALNIGSTFAYLCVEEGGGRVEWCPRVSSFQGNTLAYLRVLSAFGNQEVLRSKRSFS